MSGDNFALIVGQIVGVITTIVGIGVMLYRENRNRRWDKEDRNVVAAETRHALRNSHAVLASQITQGAKHAEDAFHEANAVNNKIRDLNARLLEQGLASKAGRTPTRVLVVDDDPVSIRLASLVLRAAGARVLTAGTEAETYAALVWEPHVILMDIELTSVVSQAGIGIAQRLAASHPNIPVVLFTAHRLRDKEVTAAGVAGTIGKPIDIDTFAATVEGYRAKEIEQ